MFSVVFCRVVHITSCVIRAHFSFLVLNVQVHSHTRSKRAEGLRTKTTIVEKIKNKKWKKNLIYQKTIVTIRRFKLFRTSSLSCLSSETRKNRDGKRRFGNVDRPLSFLPAALQSFAHYRESRSAYRGKFGDDAQTCDPQRMHVPVPV